MSALLAALAAIVLVPQGATSSPPRQIPAPSVIVGAEKTTVDAPRLAIARRLIALTDLDATLDGIYVQLSPVFASAVVGMLTNDAAAKPVMAAIMSRENGNDRFIAIMSQEFMTEMRSHYPEVKEHAARRYAAAFTLDELNALVDFYSSGAGAKALRLMPQLQRQMALDGREIGRTAGMAAGKRGFERAAREILDTKLKPKA